jgi:hypothetical protein
MRSLRDENSENSRHDAAASFPWAGTIVVALLAVAAYEFLIIAPRHERLESRITQLDLENQRLRSDVALIDDEESEASETESAESQPLVEPVARPLHAYPIPASAGFCGEDIPLDDPEVHQRFEDEWNRFLVNRHWLVSWMRRARAAYPPVEGMLARAGLPDDLKYVMTIESAIDPRATSSAGAAGYWQFIGGTGRRYGLHHTTTLDERRDLDKATQAAIAYLSDLHAEFQSWPLALSAYNAGESRVRGTISEQGTDDFYALNLPRETEAYWFKAAALKVLFEHPERYGFELPDDGWQAVSCDTLRIQTRTPRLDLREVAAAAGISYRKLKQFNPWYRRSYMAAGQNKLVLPKDSVAPLLAAFPDAEVVGAAPRLAQRRDEELAAPAEVTAPGETSSVSSQPSGAPWH